MVIRMSKSKKAQIPMDPGEYKRLQGIADREGVSVAELVRRAVRERYFAAMEQGGRKRALAGLLSLGRIRAQAWPALKKEISGRHGAAFS